MVLGVPLSVNRFYAGEIRKYYERLLAVEARTAHVRFGLTYTRIIRGRPRNSKEKPKQVLERERRNRSSVAELRGACTRDAFPHLMNGFGQHDAPGGV